MATIRKTKKKFSVTKEIHAIARERVGTVKPGHAIEPRAEKAARKPKYKVDPLKQPLAEE